MPDSNVIRVFQPNNSFDLFTPGLDVDLTRVPLLLEDLNNDFQLESITVGSDFNNQSAYVFAWKPNGQQASGFPIQVRDNSSLNGWFNHTRVIAGDFDGDGAKDILVQEGLTSTTYVLRLFNHDGTAKPFNAPVLTGIPFAMAAADLDHNGKLETILANYNGFSPRKPRSTFSSLMAPNDPAGQWTFRLPMATARVSHPFPSAISGAMGMKKLCWHANPASIFSIVTGLYSPPLGLFHRISPDTARLWLVTLMGTVFLKSLPP